MSRGFPAGWIGFFVVLVVCLGHFAWGKGSSDSISVELNRLAQQATRKRAGVLLWMELPSSRVEIYGDANLADEKFRPGSLFKLLTAEVAVRQGLSFRYRCSGHDRLGGKIRHCWNPQGHGELDLPKALALSCNLFFSRLGIELGFREILKAIRLYPEFSKGLLEADRAWSEEELADLAIGDSPFFKVTPRQMARFWIDLIGKLSEARNASIAQGLRRSVQEGTASRHGASQLEVLAKTGTADSEQLDYRTDAWFLGACPAARPRYAFVIFLKRAHGYAEASDWAEEIFRLCLKRDPAGAS